LAARFRGGRRAWGSSSLVVQACVANWGVTRAGDIDEYARDPWNVSDVSAQSALSAYIRSRDSDPKSSFGHVIAVSRPIDQELASFLTNVIADAIIAPGYEPDALAKLKAKKSGTFLAFEIDSQFEPPELESREVFGVRFEQQCDQAPISRKLFKDATFAS
jgi:phosphoribosylaminoimidazolecarboxamide formyltransferase/IMP cyclohydrolase